MNYLVEHQLNLMMVLGGICAFIILFLIVMKISDNEKKSSFIQIAFFAMILLFSDRLAYIYRGNDTQLGYWMVRICNFAVFASILLCQNGFNNYLYVLAKVKSLNDREIIHLKIGRVLVCIGIILLVISQFTGFYYYFDETNHYHRSSGFIVCYMMPLLLMLLQIIFIVKHRDAYRRRIFISLFVFIVLPAVAAVAQIFYYGVSLTSIALAVSAIVLYFLALVDQNGIVAEADKKETQRLEDIRNNTHELLYQTVEALASAVDAKDAYTHGHSNRVATYAKRIAELEGLSEEECENIYLSGLLHDVGKIGIDDNIINKNGRLTDEEFAVIKQHPTLGEQILSKIEAAPELGVGAHYHHERYDGQGYPEGLKGDDIPVFARIIAVADAYDAMTSKRSYREMIPQNLVREELIKGLDTQFDPQYARRMIHMLDMDMEYQMKENLEEELFEANSKFSFEEFKSKVTVGLRITECPVTMNIKYKSLKENGVPSILLYDSEDAKYYIDDDSFKAKMNFVEFGSICLDGTVSQGEVRKIQKTEKRHTKEQTKQEQVAEICLVKEEDHLLVNVTNDSFEYEYIFALYDSSRYLYMALTGEYCSIDILDVDVSENPVEKGYIPRIAEKISYIDGEEGDIPNVQIDGWRATHSESVEVTNDMEVTFNTKSLPSAVHIWHCTYICLFISDDGMINGSNYKEIALVRLDGEAWCEEEDVINTTSVSKDENFESWDIWRQKNKAGVNCRLHFTHEGDTVTLTAENSGISIINETKLSEAAEKVYFFFTGDQCAITDIHIFNNRV